MSSRRKSWTKLQGRYIVAFHIAVSYNVYLSGSSGQAMLTNTAAAVSVLLAAIVVGKGGGGQWH